MPKRKKVLITGANGFTGRHLSALLSAEPAIELVLADRNAPRTPDARFHGCDFRDARAVARLITEAAPRELYHLIGSYTNDYDTDYVSNVLTAKHILDALRSEGTPCRVLLVGSSAEYGFPNNPRKGVPETHPLLPVSMYGLAKVYLTKLMGLYVRLYDMDIVAVRPFNLRGRGISRTLFAGSMEEQIANYKRGTLAKIVAGDLSVERDYIDIGTAIQYYRKVMERGTKGEVYNVGSGKSVSLKAVLAKMLREAGLSMKIVREGRHETPGKIVVPKIFADVSKICAL